MQTELMADLLKEEIVPGPRDLEQMLVIRKW